MDHLRELNYLICSLRIARSTAFLIGATALSVAMALVAAELILRYTSIALNKTPEGFLFFESPQNFRDQRTEFGYRALSRNREVAIYAEGETAWIEYDVEFTTNNAGFVQRRDIDPSKPHTVVVGNSFTQGQGASPWFYDLEGELRDRALANLGVAGTGVQHWERAVDWFQLNVARVEKVVVIFIASDFARPLWFAESNQNETRFCYEQSCSAIFTKLADASPGALVKQRREHFAKQMRPIEEESRSAYDGFKTLLARTRTGSLLISTVRRIRSAPPKHLEENKRSLQRLLARHDVVVALHLPEKVEAFEGRWSKLSLDVKNIVSAMDVHYVDGMTQCAIGSGDFLRHDLHPNALGYRKIRECVTELLRTHN